MKTIFVPLSGNPQRIVATSSNNSFCAFTAFGFSGFVNSAPLDNTATAYLGYETGRMPLEITAGSYVSVDTAYTAKQKDNLYNFWARGTSGDGLYIIVY